MSRIREGTAADLARLRAIQAATLAEPWPELLETAPDGPQELLVIEAGDVVGYALAVADGSVAYVPEFAVHPDWQGEGYGSRLMDGLCDRLARAGFETLRLTVHADDRRARGFYRSHGFEMVECLPDHYADGDGLLLARSPIGRG
jgi:ribosomal-protein-alanine N-acetyltransferase